MPGSKASGVKEFSITLSHYYSQNSSNIKQLSIAHSAEGKGNSVMVQCTLMRYINQYTEEVRLLDSQT